MRPSAHARGQQWELTINLAEDMWRSRLEPDVVGFKAAVSACQRPHARGQQWEHAINLSQEMWRSRFEPIVIGFNAAISAG